MAKKFLLTCVLPAFVMMTLGVGQARATQDLRRPALTGAIGLTYVTFDSDSMEQQGLGDSAFGVDIKGAYQFSPILAAGFGLGVLRFRDKEEFSQDVVVTNIFGSETDTLTSSATAITLFAELNYQIPSTSSVRFRLGAGYGGVTGADRDIENCSNCRSEDLDIEGGAYLTAKALFNTYNSERLGYGISVRQYLSGDMSNNISFWLEYTNP